MENFKQTNETNKLTWNKPPDSETICYSEHNRRHTCYSFKRFSLKIEATGHTCYKVREEYSFLCPGFYKNVNPAFGSAIGHKLRSLLPAIENHGNFSVSNKWISYRTKRIICKEYGFFLALKNRHSIKTTTKKEIFRRLQLGREYMDNHFLSVREIKEVASFCSMSEYHFFRSFKQAFGITPYQYITKKKMECACELLHHKDKTLSEIALMCNFPDVFTFSKAFKRYYGVPPSQKR